MRPVELGRLLVIGCKRTAQCMYYDHRIILASKVLVLLLGRPSYST